MTRIESQTEYVGLGRDEEFVVEVTFSVVPPDLDSNYPGGIVIEDWDSVPPHVETDYWRTRTDREIEEDIVYELEKLLR